MFLRKLHAGIQLSSARELKEKDQNYEQSKQWIKDPQADPRDIKMIIDFKKVTDLINGDITNTSTKDILRKWMVDMIQNIASDAFLKYDKGQLKQSEAKSYTAKNFLFNVYKFMQEIIPKVTKDQQQHIYEFIQKEFVKIIDCIIAKYPQADAKGGVSRLQKSISRTDNRENDQFDLLRYPQNGAVFEYREDGNYASPIMATLNYIMEIASKPLFQSNDTQTNFDGFNLMLQNIFTYAGCKQYETQFFKQLSQYPQKKEEQKFGSFFQLFLFSEGTQKPKVEQYKKKVLQQCKYKINQKISPNIKLFKKQEIEEGIFMTSDVSILRVMTKWAQQLREKLKMSKENILKRVQHFKNKKGELIQLNQKQKQSLYKKAEEQQKRIKKVMKNLKQHCSIMGLQLNLRNYQIQYANQTDGNMAILASHYQACVSKYMFEYLNQLIHSLLRIPIQAKKLYPTPFSWDYEKADEILTVNLITFKIGDLMRSRCKASQKHILKIYKTMQKMSQTCPQILRIVRVKDRLDSKDNDILMNIFFMNKIQCEIQISVATNVDPKQQHFNTYNHFVYELKRSQFGPIAESACILSQYDPLTKLYTSKPQTLSVTLNKMHQKNKVSMDSFIMGGTSIQKNADILNMPFFCNICSTFNRNSNPVFYKNLKQIQTCNKCYQRETAKTQSRDLIEELFRFKYRKGSDHMQKILKHFKFLKTKSFKHFSQILEIKKGFIINKNSLKPSPQFFQTVTFDESLYFVRYQKSDNSDENSKIILRLNQYSKWTEKLNQFIIFVLNNVEGQITTFTRQNDKELYCLKCSCCTVSTMNLGPTFTAQKNTIVKENQNFFNDICKKEKETLYIADRFLTTQLQKMNPKNNIKRLYAFGNNIKDTKFLQKFEKVEAIDLSNNKITQMTQINFSKGVNNIKSLNYSNNRITEIKGLENFNQLTQLKLNKNQISSIPLLKGLNNIKYLTLNANKISDISGLKSISSLTYLSLNSNQIDKIQNLDTLVELQELYIYNNNLTIIENLDNNKKLKILYIRKNKFTKIENLNSLQKLQKLNLAQNQIRKIQNLEKLVSLNELYLFDNKIEKLENLNNISLLELHIYSNQIEKIQNLQNLQQLSLLDLSKNNIQRLQNLTNLTNLKSLIIHSSKIKKIQNLQNLTSLTQLNLYNNEIQKIQNLSGLVNLTKLNLSNNIIQVIQNINKLGLLSELLLHKNQIKNIQNVDKLNYLTKLQLDGNVITKIQKLQKLQNLIMLSLNENQIQVIQNLEKNLFLVEVELGHNRIKKIENLQKLMFLSSLKLSENSIECIENLERNHSLTVLDLSSNPLLPSQTQNINQMKSLGINIIT